MSGGTHNSATTAAPYSGFAAAGVMTATATAPAKSAGSRGRRRRGGKNVAAKGNGTGGAAKYVPVEVPAEEDLMSAYSASLAMADNSFPPELCGNPLPLLAAVVGVLAHSEASPQLPDESKAKVTDAIRFLAERMASLRSLVDPSAPTVNAAHLLPGGTQRRGPARTFLQDIARGFARRVPLTKLVSLDGDVRPYLASLMVSALHRAGGTLVIPEGLQI